MNDSLINHLRHSGDAELSPDQRQRMRHVLLQEFDHLRSEPIPTIGWFTRLTHYHRPAVAATLVASLVIGLLTVSAAANAAKPGDALFGLDQAVEQVTVHLALTPAAKANIEVNIAAERAAEQRQLEAKHSTHAGDAERQATRALDQAVQRVDQAQKAADDHGSDRASAALRATKDRLKTLQTEQVKRRDGSTPKKDGRDTTETKDDHDSGRSEQPTNTSINGTLPVNSERSDDLERVERDTLGEHRGSGDSADGGD